MQSQAEREVVDRVVNHARQAQNDDACRANQQAGTCVVVAAESSNGGIGRGDVHSFDNPQVIVKRNYRVDQCNEHQQMETAVEGCREDEELREEACERRDTGQ